MIGASRSGISLQKADYNNQLNMRQICARWIPKMLNTDQKRLRVECCEQLLKRLEREREKFMDRIVTVDETWISLYTPETKAQTTIWKTPGSPSPKKFKMSQSTKKQMFVVFFDPRGVILPHAVPPGQTGMPHTIRRWVGIFYLLYT